MTATKTVRLTGLRGMIAQKMQESVAKTAQLSFLCDVDASALVAARSAWKAAEFKVGYEDLIIRALASVLERFPLFNALEGEAGVELQDRIHVSCAIALPGTLVAPAIFDVQTLGVPAIASAREDLVARAKTGKLSVREMSAGTITVTNLGLTRVEHFTPILNRPQQAIIGLGRIAPRPWVAEDGATLVVRPVIGLSLTVDHRVIDGGPAGDFLTALATEIETNPARP